MRRTTTNKKKTDDEVVDEIVAASRAASLVPEGVAGAQDAVPDEDESPGIHPEGEEPVLEGNPFDEEPIQLQIPGLAPKMERIISRIFEVDVDRLDQELDGALRMARPPSATTPTAIADDLEAADEAAEKALRLSVVAAKAKDDFESDVRLLEADLRSRARAALEAEKDAGTRKKAIVKEDVTDWIAEHYQDHQINIDKRRSSLKRACEYFEGRAAIFKQRANHLDTISRGVGRS